MSGSQPPANRPTPVCVFCLGALEGQKRSQEHVLGRWLRKVEAIDKAFHLPTNGGQRRTTLDVVVDSATGLPVDLEQRPLRSKALHALYLTVPVCRQCNNGWMSSLEQETAPVLTGLINDETRMITPADADVLARWLSKTALAFERDDPLSARMVDAQRRDVLRGRPSRWTTIWAARWNSPEDVLLRHATRRWYDFGTRTALLEEAVVQIGLGRGIAFELAAAPVPVPPAQALDPGDPWKLIWPRPIQNVQLAPLAVDRAHFDARAYRFDAHAYPMADRDATRPSSRF